MKEMMNGTTRRKQEKREEGEGTKMGILKGKQENRTKQRERGGTKRSGRCKGKREGRGGRERGEMKGENRC